MRKNIAHYQTFAAVMAVILLFSVIPIPARAERNTVEIHTAADFMEFAENCKTDGWSAGREIVLKNDLEISDPAFEGIAYFNGTFRGCGYTISFRSMEPVGSHYGFFRYIGSMGIVRDLNVHGSIVPTGSASKIGGIAGVNQGMILHCSYTGSVKGKNEVGGIAGDNTETGMILNCVNDAMVLATDQTGGIAGRNEGLIADCTNRGNINTRELDTTMDLGGVDIGTLNLTGNIVTRNNMGGIAGVSEGIITGCANSGVIGFEHTGYNVGGIAGSQNGQLFDCTNEGAVYGRKDVGGIVGQASPYIEATYLSEKVDHVQAQVSGLNNTLNGIVSSVSDTAQEGRDYADQLRIRYQEEWNTVSRNLTAIMDTISDNKAATDQYRENIRNAMDAIASEGDNIITQELDLEDRDSLSEDTDWEDLWEQGIDRDGLQDGLDRISENRILDQIDDDRISEQTEESARRIREQLQVIDDNLRLLREQCEIDEETEEEWKTGLQEELQNSSKAEDMEQFLDIIEQGGKEVSDGISSALAQIDSALDTADADMTTLRDGGFMEDISKAAYDSDTKGLISGCDNFGSVYGDINAGGIAGTMNIEYGGDPEIDISFAGDVNIVVRATINDVIMDCKNFGAVRVKKNHGGGIVGGQILGLVYSCEAYGYVIAETGDELGGIAGYSEAAVRGCYSLCSLKGQDRLGGICGYGSTIENCLSICELTGDGECRGAVAGEVDEEGSRIGNFFVSDTLEGIDGISYLGIAEHRTHSEMMQMEGIPEDFHQIRVTFMADETALEERQTMYGAVLKEEDFPAVPEKEGYYAQWDYDDTPLHGNAILTAEYIPWIEALAGGETDEDGRIRMLAVGEFYQEDVLYCSETAEISKLPLTEQDTLLYSYAWEIDMPKQHTLPTEMECHFAVSKPGQTTLYLMQDGVWTPVPAAEDGSYLVAAVPYGAPFALVESGGGMPYAVVIAAGGTLLLIALAVMVRKKRKNNKAAQKTGKSEDGE